ncbi:MAG: hypothetical protein BGO98_10825 [Myxococcales bacterium 68-20]|nr:MAG: hypothetical protein BGO98_10825 [Myxococcales bacterium 68-20]
MPSGSWYAERVAVRTPPGERLSARDERDDRGTRTRGSGRAFSLGLVLSVLVACGSFGEGPLSNDPLKHQGDSCSDDLATDSDNCGACGTRCAAGSVCEAGVCRAGCRDRVLHVSGEGNDGNDGCTKDRPIRTISAAIALAATQRLERHELHVCRGIYSESSGFRLAYPVSIRGGYNCATWTRGDRFGKAGAFADINTTELVSASTTTLTVAGEAVTRDVIVEGLTIDGPREGTETGVALAVTDGASPMLTELVLRGGATTSASAVGSVALRFLSGARGELKDSLVDGGGGTGTVGSIGVSVVDAQPLLHDNVIDAGEGTGSTIGAVAVQVDGGEKSFATLEKNHITWRRPTAALANISAVVGIRVDGGGVDATRNVVRGGTSACAQPWCFVMGVELVSAVRSKLRLNAITLGGLVSPPNPTAAAAYRFGVRMLGDGTQPAEIIGNVIHAGGDGLPANIFPIGMDVLAGDGHVIQANTILSAAPGSTRWGVRVGAGAVYIAKNVSLTGNLFVGADSSILHASCTGSSFAAIKNNLFVAPANAATTFADAAGVGCGGTFPYPAGMEAQDPTRRSGNRAIRPACVNTHCVPNVACTDLATCAQQVFSAWDTPSFGRATVEGPEGLRLRSDGLCAVNNGGDAPSAFDINGRMRTAPFSFGAAEEDSCK